MSYQIEGEMSGIEDDARRIFENEQRYNAVQARVKELREEAICFSYWDNFIDVLINCLRSLKKWK